MPAAGWTPAHPGWWVWVLVGTNTKGPEIMENSRISHLLLQVQSRSNAEQLAASRLPTPAPRPPRGQLSQPPSSGMRPGWGLPLPVRQLSNPQTTPRPHLTPCNSLLPKAHGLHSEQGSFGCRGPASLGYRVGEEKQDTRQGSVQSLSPGGASAWGGPPWGCGSQGCFPRGPGRGAGSQVPAPPSPQGLGLGDP